MSWFNRTPEEERLMRGPLSGYSPVMPWNQDANIRHNRRLEEEARIAEMIANNPALAARLAAEEEAKAVARANEQWADTRRTDNGYAKVYSDDVQVARNMAQDNQMAQEAYNRDYGTDYAGGPLQDPSYRGLETRWPSSVAYNGDALQADLANGTHVRTGHGTPTGYATSPLNGMMPVVDPSTFMARDQAYEQERADREAAAGPLSRK